MNKYAFTLICTLCFACNSRSKESLRVEYDSIVLQKSKTERLLYLVKKGQDDYQYISTDSANLYWTTYVDSLEKERSKLESKRQQLAKELF